MKCNTTPPSFTLLALALASAGCTAADIMPAADGQVTAPMRLLETVEGGAGGSAEYLFTCSGEEAWWEISTRDASGHITVQVDDGIHTAWTPLVKSKVTPNATHTLALRGDSRIEVLTIHPETCVWKATGGTSIKAVQAITLRSPWKVARSVEFDSLNDDCPLGDVSCCGVLQVPLWCDSSTDDHNVRVTGTTVNGQHAQISVDGSPWMKWSTAEQPLEFTVKHGLCTINIGGGSPGMEFLSVEVVSPSCWLRPHEVDEQSNMMSRWLKYATWVAVFLQVCSPFAGGPLAGGRLFVTLLPCDQLIDVYPSMGTPPYTAPLFFNTAVFLAFLGTHAAVAFLSRWRANVLFPYLSLLVFFAAFPGIVFSSFTLLFNSDLWYLGGATLLTVGVGLQLSWKQAPDFNTVAVFGSVTAETKLAYMIKGSGEWVSVEEGCRRRYGAVYLTYTPMVAAWFVLVEIGFTVVVCAVQSAHTGTADGCYYKRIVLAAVHVGYAGVLVWHRPFARPMNTVMDIAAGLFLSFALLLSGYSNTSTALLVVLTITICSARWCTDTCMAVYRFATVPDRSVNDLDDTLGDVEMNNTLLLNDFCLTAEELNSINQEAVTRPLTPTRRHRFSRSSSIGVPPDEAADGDSLGTSASISSGSPPVPPSRGSPKRRSPVSSHGEQPIASKGRGSPVPRSLVQRARIGGKMTV